MKSNLQTEAVADASGGESLVERIASALAKDIVEGRLKPGQRILHQDLTSRFAVSFGPIREALLKLEQEHLVEILPRRGARVVELTLEHVEDLMAIRGAVYPVLIRAAIARGSDEELARFAVQADKLVKTLRSSAGIGMITKASVQTGYSLVDAAHAPWAADIINATVRQLHWVSNRLTVAEHHEREEAAAAWERLGPAVAARDIAAADAAGRDMLMRAVWTVMPKLYAERGLTEAEIELRLSLFAEKAGAARRGRPPQTQRR